MPDQDPIDVAIKEIAYIAGTTYGLQSIMEEHSDTNAFNYHAKEYYRGLAQTYQSAARKALTALKDAKAAAPVSEEASGLTDDREIKQPIPTFARRIEPVIPVTRVRIRRVGEKFTAEIIDRNGAEK
jgi:hypothetical protein